MLEHPLQRSLTMKWAAVIAMTITLAACMRSEPKRAASTAKHEVQTIDNAEMKPIVFDPPPILTDEGTPPTKSTVGVAQPDAPPPPTPQDEALRASLPFAPAIAMDPVDGSKVSIRTSTPMLDLKNKVYYFSSEENKRLFVASPETYMKGAFSHL